MNIEREYQINTVISSQEGDIASGGRMCVEFATTDDSSGFRLLLVVTTWQDGSHNCQKRNTHIDGKYTYTILESEMSDAKSVLIDKYFKPDIETQYGAENIVVI